MIFVVEDDPDTRDFMHDMLLMWGYQVCTFESMAEISKYLQSPNIPPSLLVVDLNIDGDTNGVEVIQKVRLYQGLANVKALILTGNTSFRASNCPMGQVDVLYKPIRPEMLKQIIRVTLASNGY